MTRRSRIATRLRDEKGRVAWANAVRLGGHSLPVAKDLRIRANKSAHATPAPDAACFASTHTHHRARPFDAGRLRTRLLHRLALVVTCLPLIGCPAASFNPFLDLPAVAMDGVPRLMQYDVAPLGELAVGQVIRVKVEGGAVQSAMILAADTESDDAGLLAGGGPPGRFFDYRVQIAGRYFVYVLFDPASALADRVATLTVMPGDDSYHPPRRQAVRVVFEEDFLTNPGLVDPTSFTQDEIRTLADITNPVRTQVVERLRVIFADTPIDILTEYDPLPAGAYSVLTYKGQRRQAAPGEFNDVTIPPLLPEHPECQDQVVFGEVLNNATMVDVGNSLPNDQAVVYVGSFQNATKNMRDPVGKGYGIS